MKNYIAPQIQMLTVAPLDVITTSGQGDFMYYAEGTTVDAADYFS